MKTQRTFNHLDHDGNSKYTRSTLRLTVDIVAVRALPPKTNMYVLNDKEKNRGANILVALLRVGTDGYGDPWS